ncbi:hypothetical protein CF319_g6792 [Tilletia indica]|nr:hypothetical protein CF319_g6792 [Tilletia indica]
MDIPALTALLSTSTSTLAALHAELGHPPQHLQDALALLADTVRSTVDSQIASVRTQVEQVGKDCESARLRAEGLRRALGEVDVVVGLVGQKTGRAGKKSGEKGNTSETLLVKKTRLEQEASQLQETYMARCGQVDTLLEHITHFAPVLEGGSTADMSADNISPTPDADDPIVPPFPQRESITIEQSTELISLPIASNSYINALTAHLNGLHALQEARSLRFQSYLQYIFDLWGTLHLRPHVEDDAFERAICRAAAVRPVMSVADIDIMDEETGEVTIVRQTLFKGLFETVEEGEDDRMEETPLLLPSVTTLRKLRNLLEELEGEKSRREERIQRLYDELFILWSRFDCDESEMDEFVLENKGLSLESIKAYECELDKMLTLKAQHSLTFIARIRDQMTQYAQSARLSPTEVETLFPEFFIPLPAPDAQQPQHLNGEAEPAYDGLLAAHEQAIPRILALIEAKAVVMKLVERYEEVCREEEELLESAKNTSRLFAGGKKGMGAAGGPGAGKVEKPKRDPGRLLREEKMRKRVKVLKPKLEAEMMKSIPAWEQENGEAFMLDGERYMDKLEALVVARKPVSSIPPVSSVSNLAGQKRGRQGSVGPSPMPTPSGSRVNSLVLSTPLGPSSAHNRTASSSSSVSAAGRGRPAPPQTPMQAPLAKKARLASVTGPGPGTATRPASKIAGPTPTGAGRNASSSSSSGVGLGSSVGSMLGRTPAALQASRKANLNNGSMLGAPRRPGPPQGLQPQKQTQQQQQPAITLLPPSAPFRPRPSVGVLPYANHHSAAEQESDMEHQRVTSGSSNISLATSNAGTVIVHSGIPQRSMFGALSEDVEVEVTPPLFFDGVRKKSGEGEGSKRERGNRSRPSLSLQKSLLAHPDDSAVGDASTVGGGASSSSMRLVSSEIARRLGVAAAAAGGGGGAGSGTASGVGSSNWDRLMEEEDDLEEEDLVLGMGSVAEEEEAEAEEDVVHAVAHEEMGGGGVRRSRRVVAAAAH